MHEDDQKGRRPPWWSSGVLYQIYPRSFGDSDGDGTGDLQGIIDHLDHLSWLGVDGIWLSPITVSPNADWGYDVADYLAVDPDLGSDADVDRLVAEAGERGIRVVLDLVPNHTSAEHPWFVDARSSRQARYRDWYVWADPKEDGSPPNNWVSSFGGPAWTLDRATGQYYLHNHLRQQPDLNWWNDEVRHEFDRILEAWLDRGVAGFRIDVANIIVKDAMLRDNPPASDSDSWEERVFGQRSVYNANRPEVHDVLRRWRALADRHPGSVLIGETHVDSVEALAAYYGTGQDELHLAFNFPFMEAALEAPRLRAIVERVEETLPAGGWPAWTGSNHDMSRLATRWARDDPAKARAALVMLICLRGTPVLYQGDEVGLADVAVPHDQMKDPLGVLYWPAYAGRDSMRTPMPWRDAEGGGFTRPEVRPWLPLGELGPRTVEAQRDDPGSILCLTRDLIALRRRSPDLQTGKYATVEAPPEVWAWRRGEHMLVVINMADDERAVDAAGGIVRLSTDRRQEGTSVEGRLELGPWEAVVVESSS